MPQNQRIPITAEICKSTDRISQRDIFKDITIIEDFENIGSEMHLRKLYFPFVICLNQDCDLNSDKRASDSGQFNKDCRLLHFLVAPVFTVDSFLASDYWGNIFADVNTIGKKGFGKVENNEVSRYHFLHFPNDSRITHDFIIDFKHFFTVSSRYMYKNIDKRLCSIDVLYRELVNQRFANYLSRIGLPGKEDERL